MKTKYKFADWFSFLFDEVKERSCQREKNEISWLTWYEVNTSVIKRSKYYILGVFLLPWVFSGNNDLSKNLSKSDLSKNLSKNDLSKNLIGSMILL